MKKITSLIILLATTLTMAAQTLNVQVGEVVYQIPAAQAGDMVYSEGTTISILNKVYTLSDIDRMYIDATPVTDNSVSVGYDGTKAQVLVAGNVAQYLTINANGAHVAIVQNADVTEEITYTLSGNSTDGSFYMDGQLKASLVLNGLTLHNPDSAAINIRDGKRINVELASGTTNTLTDGTGGTQKGCFAVKGHTEFKGGGTLNITGNSAHAFWGKEYVELKKTTGTINILGAKGDGFNVNQYFTMNGGTVSIKGVSDDGIQVSYETDDNDNVVEDAENTGDVTIKKGDLSIAVTGDGAKGIKAAHNVNIQGGTVTIDQTGGLTVENGDISYPTSIKADGDINITGGTVTINNTATGGKGLSADGAVNIDESNATTYINITANGAGGVVDVESSGDTGATASSYKVYVSIPTSGGGGGPGGGSRAWSKVYLYKSDGTLVQQLTNTVSKSSGYYTYTFYYYDFKEADSGSYYFKSDNYTGGGGWGGGTTYTIQSQTFYGPTSGSDIYYSITNSYTTSGTTRTYALTNVTSTFAGSQDLSEDEGKSYNAAGIKADGDVTIKGGTIIIKNSGEMSKSIKSKATVTIDGGDITLTPSGAMRVVNSDASYSMGVKTVDFVQNDGTLRITASATAGRGISATNITTNGGTLTINNSGGGQSGSTDDYTAKGLKADAKIALNGGTISIAMTGNGGKGIKADGTYTQGLADGSGPTLTVTTTGSRFGSSSSGGGWGWGPGGSSGGGSAKAIKVQGTVTLYGGTTEVSTKTDGAEGLESKTAIYVEGGQHYLKCYDDCINSSGSIYFNGGMTICYSNGNDAIDSNAGRTGAITIGNGAVLAYTSAGGPEEGFDCDNNSYIQITGTGIGISGGSSQGGGGWGGSSSTISGAKQGYTFYTNSVSYAPGRYYTLLDSSNKNLVTYSVEASFTSTLSLITATGMTSGSTYQVKYTTTEPTDATSSYHGLYLGSQTVGSTQAFSFTAK